jgi:hypothetical protein
VGTMGNMEGFNGNITVGNIMSFQSSWMTMISY